MKKESFYYDYSLIWGYGCKINLIIGARGIGKSYGAKRYLIKQFLHNKKKFIWIRDTEPAIEELRKNKGQKFFVDVANEFKDLNGEINNDVITINGEHAGYVMPLSTYYRYKGNAYDEIKTIVFDEFIDEIGQRKNPYRTQAFINTIETIGRLRTDYKILMLANALNKGDEILNLFGFKFNDFGFYVNREKSAVLHYADNNPEFNEKRNSSISALITNGTNYADNIQNNKFMSDENIYYDRRPMKCKVFGIVHDRESAARLYTSPTDGLVYVSSDISPVAYPNDRFVNRKDYVDTNKQLINAKGLKFIKEQYGNKLMRFENAYIRGVFMRFINGE